MAQFPRTQAETVELAESILTGLTQHADIFKTGDPNELRKSLDEYNSADIALAESQKRVSIAASSKREVFNRMLLATKRLIKQAELDSADDPSQLELIGWGPRKNPAQAPRELSTAQISTACPEQA